MTKNLLMFLSFSLFTLSPLSGAIYKGQKIFVKQCVECHDSGQAFVAEHRIRDYRKWMNKRGKGLAEIHLKSKKAKKSHKYFKSSAYSKKSKHLKDFLTEYAKDSGNVPACN